MTDLVVSLGTEKTTQNYIVQLITKEDWDKIYIICTAAAKETFKTPKEVQFLIIDDRMMLPQLTNDLVRKFERRFGMDVALNLVSGSGKEHMAILGALVKSGVGIRLIALTPEGIKEI